MIIKASYSARVRCERSNIHSFSSPGLLDTTLSFCVVISVSLKIARLSESSACIPLPCVGTSPTLVTVASVSGVNLRPMKYPCPQSVTICPLVCFVRVPVILLPLTVTPVCICDAVVPQKSVSAGAAATVRRVINLLHPVQMS